MINLMEEGRKVAASLSATYPQQIRKLSEATRPVTAGFSVNPQDPQNPQLTENGYNGRSIDPLADLDISPCNLHWINKTLTFKPAKQRLALLKEYRRLYLEAADAIPEQLSHRKANAGTRAGNTWLRETILERR